MSGQGRQVLEQALSVSPEERLKVAELLLSNLDSPIQPSIDSLWAAEAEDRIDAFDRGEVQGVPASDVLDEVTKRNR
jgi:Putative addiction module component